MKYIFNTSLSFFFLPKFICLVFSLNISHFLFSESSNLKVTENAFFEIVGAELVSVNFANELSNYVAESILDDFYEADYNPSNKILIQLLNFESTFNDSDFYELNISNLGHVTINIKWDESLPLPVLIEAFTVSFIQSFGFSIFGQPFLEKYPTKAWMLKGITQDIYVSLRPNVSCLYYEKAIIEGFDTVYLDSNLIDNDLPTDAQSFGFYQYVKSQKISRNSRIRIFWNALLGSGTLQSIYRSFGLDSKESMIFALNEFLNLKYRNNLGKFETLAVSKNWLEALADFSSIEIESSKTKLNSLHLLCLHKADPRLIEIIKARIHLISLGLSKINPLYYNAALSLALTYQKILDSTEEWESLYYFSDFLDEIGKANTVSLQITEQLKLKRP